MLSSYDESYIELNESMETRTEIAISKESLYNLHQNQLSTNKSNDIKMKELVDSLGGIDVILSTCLYTENGIDLNQTQLKKIYDILSEDHESPNIAPRLNTYIFRKSNIIIEQISNVSSEKLLKIVYNFYVLIFMASISLIAFVWFIIVIFVSDTPNSWRIFAIYRILWAIALLIWLIMVSFTININAFKLSSKQFMFWFKTLTTFEYVCCGFIIDEYFSINSTKNSSKTNIYPFIFYTSQIIFYLDVLLITILICALDSLYMSRKVKILVNSCMAVLWTGFMLINVLDAPEHDMSIVTVTKHLSFSIHSLYVDSLRILAVFFSKQAITLTFHPNQCVTIRQSMYFEWH